MRARRQAARQNEQPPVHDAGPRPRADVSLGRAWNLRRARGDDLVRIWADARVRFREPRRRGEYLREPGGFEGTELRVVLVGLLAHASQPLGAAVNAGAYAGQPDLWDVAGRTSPDLRVVAH